MQLSLDLWLTSIPILDVSWQRSQDHEVVRDVIHALHLDGGIVKVRLGF